MNARLRAEWLKLITTRSFYGILAGAAAVAAVGTLSTTASAAPAPWHMTQPLHGEVPWLLATINGGLFALVLGARTFTDEFHHGTIVHTYIADPGRRRSTIAKAGAAALSGVLVGFVVVAVLVATAVVMAALSDGRIGLHASDVPAAVGLMAGMALWAVLGAGLGAVVRNQVAVVAGGLLWVLMLENLGAGLLDEAGRYLPGQTVHALARTTEGLHGLGVASAATLMATYATLAVIAGMGVSRRRDIA